MPPTADPDAASVISPVSPPVRLPPYAVAICTYNGARFVGEQLDSIFTAEPCCAELVLVDDASSDDTLTEVASAVAGRPVACTIEVNAANRGSRASFETAITRTTQPIVFLADQDDVWHRDKPQRMLAEFAERPELLLLHTDANLVDDALRPLGHTLFEAIEVTAAERADIRRGDAFDAFVRRNCATGATLAFRRTLLDVALPIPDGWVHDEWLATIAAAIGRVDLVDAALIDYRQHGGNQIGARRLTFREKLEVAFDKVADYYARHRRRTTVLLERLLALGTRVPPDRIAKIREKLHHLEARERLPANRVARVLPIAGELLAGRYARYSTGYKSIARDLLHRA